MSGAVKVELVLAGTTTAKSYYFRPVNGTGWASCTVNDGTAELSVQSDWGDGAYRWHVHGLGVPTLTEFIADADEDYLSRKLLGRDRMEVFDADETTRNLLRGIIAMRRNGVCTPAQARDAWDALQDADPSDDDVAVYAMNVPSEVADLLDLGEFTVYGPSREAIAFRGWILPALRAACAAEVAARRASAFPTPAPGPVDLLEDAIVAIQDAAYGADVRRHPAVEALRRALETSS